MSAQEVIEQIKGMPSTERDQVIDYVRDLPTVVERSSETAPPKQDFRALALKIMSEHDELFRKLAQ